MPLERISRTCFQLIHGKNLVYNQCWEDPRLDRVALNLTPEDRVLVITSAGCNALDYALAGAGHVHAVDMNFRQNALLELKQSAIRHLDHQQFFQMFGRGVLPNWNELYPQQLRPGLSAEAQQFWDRCGKTFFKGARRRPSFYFRGTSGLFAWMVNGYINRVARIRRSIDDILDAQTLEEQQEIYYGRKLGESLFKPLVQWMLRRDTTMAMLGVPRSQRKQLDEGYPGGIVQFIVDRIETVFAKLPLHDNYFWRVYLTGQYTPTCCPEYLKAENFDRLRSVVDQVTTHTNSVLGFLEGSPEQISRFILLDHMDWLYSHYQDVLTAEWQGIVDRAAPGARVLWRSAGLKVDFVDPIVVRANGQSRRMEELLDYQTDLAARLHPIDRVNTYGSFYIADLNV